MTKKEMTKQMKSTLAQFKRDINIGDEIIVTSVMHREYATQELVSIDIPEKLQGYRKVTYKDTTGFYLKKESDTSNRKGSFCGYPQASELEYYKESNTFIITDDCGQRAYLISTEK